jgi:glycosyltransferase involved in cell wall biosynthesis
VRIAIVELAPVGGLLHYAVQLADALAERGHDVELVVPRGNELVGRQGRARVRAVLPPPVRQMEQPPGAAAYVRRQAEVAVRLSAAWLRAVRTLRRGRYDAIVLTADLSLVPATLGALLVTTVPGVTVAAVCHNVRVFNRWGGQQLFGNVRTSPRLLRAAFRRFDVVFVHGENSRREFEEEWAPARAVVIPHGDERLFGDEPPPPASEERILFFGDWRKVKGLPVLLDAFDLLAARRPSVRLTIAGTPAAADLDPQPILSWAAGHEGRVEVIARYVPISEVRPLFARARVVATPYLAGYQSGVVHLAMTMARPVVSSDVGDLGAAVRDGQTGRVVPAGDPEALADALHELVDDPERAARLGAEGRRLLLASSSWREVAERVEEALLVRRDRSADARA